MNKIAYVCLVLGASTVSAVGALAQPMPEGHKGVHWAQASFEIVQGAVVEVTVHNRTRNAQSGNRAGISLTIDGGSRGDKAVDAAAITWVELVSGNGKHTVLAICTNHLATADSCTISLRQDGVPIFGTTN